MIGDANIAVCETAAEQGAGKFVLISGATQNGDIGVLRKIAFFDAYTDGKARAEECAQRLFGGPDKALSIVRPGFIYGNNFGLPLQFVGVPMRVIFSALQLYRLPFIGHVFFEVRHFN